MSLLETPGASVEGVIFGSLLPGVWEQRNVQGCGPQPERCESAIARCAEPCEGPWSPWSPNDSPHESPHQGQKGRGMKTAPTCGVLDSRLPVRQIRTIVGVKCADALF